MIEEVEIQEPEQQQPDPPKKKLWKKLNDKSLYTKSYEDFDKQFSTPESIDKLYKNLSEKKLYTKSYQDFNSQFFQSIPEVKKKVASVDIGGSSLEAGNALSQSGGVDGEEIPTIEMYNTSTGELVEADPISLSKKYKEYSEAMKPVSEEEMGRSMGMARPTENLEKRQAAKKLKEDFPDIDVGGISGELSGISENTLANVGKELMVDRETNYPLYQRKVSGLRWREELQKSLTNSNINDEDYSRVVGLSNQLAEATKSGDFRNQREAIKSLALDIQTYGGENRDKILSDFAVEASKVYGNAYNNNFKKSIEGTPESTYLNEDAQLGIQYLEDVSPEKARQYDRLKINPNDLDGDALKGYNHLMQTAEETGISLQQNSVTEELNSLKKQAAQNGGLSEEQLQKAEQLETKQEELTQKRNELDKKYPERIGNKVADAVNEVMGHELNWGEYAMVKTGQAITNTGKGVWEAVSNPFISDASRTMRELSIMGESLESQRNLKQPDKNLALLTDKFIIEPELQTQVDNIKNNKILSDEEKRKRLFSLFYNNTDKFGRVPIKGGKFNINPSSILYGVTDIGTTLIPFMALETATGGIGGTGAAARFLRTFNAAAVTSFHDHYSQALLEGKGESEAFKEALGTTAITSFAMAGAGTPDAIRAMAGTKTSAGKIINMMSDDSINAILKRGTPKGLKAVGQAIKDRAKALPSQLLKGAEGGVKFETAMAGGEALKKGIYGGESDPEHDFKRAVVGVLNFGVLGGALGQLNFKSPTQMQKGAFLKVGEKPKDYISIAEQMRKDGQLTDVEFEQRKSMIEKAEAAYKTLPSSLSEKDKGDYMFQTVVKNDALKGKSDLPPKQAAEAEHTALVADYKREMILDQPTDKQLNDRKGVLERKLEPKKDAEGKAIEIPEKELAQYKAELEAVNDAIENKPTEEKAEPSKKNNYTEMYNKVLDNPETREQGLKDISDQWHDQRSRKLIEESITPEIIEEAKQKYPQEENKGLQAPTNAEQVRDFEAEKTKLNEEREERVRMEGKPDIKIEFLSSKELVDSIDPVGNKKRQRVIMDRYKKLRELLNCL